VRKYSFAYRVINIWNSLSSDIVNANSISVFKQKLESVDFTPFVQIEFWPVCFIVVLSSFVGHASLSSGPVCPDFCLNKWIWNSRRHNVCDNFCTSCVLRVPSR